MRHYAAVPQDSLTAALLESWQRSLRLPQRSAEPTAFAAGSISAPTRGRTREGDVCTCSDAAAKEPAASGPMAAVAGAAKDLLANVGLQDKKLSRDHDEVADEFAKQQRAAAVSNADAAAGKPADEFADARSHFDEAYEDTRLKFELYKDQRKKYETAYSKAMAAHKQYCRPFVDEHFQIPLDCEKRRQKEASRFLARMRHPDCMVGDAVSLDLPSEAAVAVDPLAIALVSSFQRRKSPGAPAERSTCHTLRSAGVAASFL